MTVIVAPSDGRLEALLEGLGHRSHDRGVARCIAALAALAALAGAVVGERAGSEPAFRHGRALEAAVTARPISFRFPLGCFEATLSSPTSPRAAEVANPAGPCWHYNVYVTAALRRVDGVWRLVLDARGNTCARVPLRPAIRAQLAACDGRAVRSPQP